jgi:cysteinyl-tRNA synthetase
MHTGTVAMAGEKMSKSLGNLAFVHDLLERHEPAALRRYLLERHYRKDFEFDERHLSAAPHPAGDGEAIPAAVLRARFMAALEEDLDTPRALAALDAATGSADPEAAAFVAQGRALLGLDL